MREWGRIKVQFWTDAKVQRLTASGKVLFGYFLTGPHANNIGCFRMPLGYIEADLGLNTPMAIETLAELLREGLIQRCEQTGWILISNYLRHNPIENPNVAKGAISQINAMPTTLPFYAFFLEKLKPYAKRFPPEFWNGLAMGMPNGMGNIEREIEKEIEPEIEMNPERDEGMDSGVCGAGSPMPLDEGSLLDEIDINAALLVWNDLAIELGLAQVQKLTDARKAKLRARLRDTGGVAGWAAVLVKIRESRFLRGDNNRSWRADFDFVLQESSFNKIKEGAYADRKLPEAPVVAAMVFKLSPEIVATLKSASFSDDEIKSWFNDAQFLDGCKRIVVSSGFKKDWIGSNYEARLTRAFGGLPVLEVAS